MEYSERLTALKKAYADIILNTAKEAAARVMVSERKVVRFQRELVSTKEESLRMLLRLKQMLDSKVREADTTSFIQKKKIEELEAQLQEAEEIVRDLREELRDVQPTLEKVKNNLMHPLDKQNVEDEAAPQENIVINDQFDPCRSLYYEPNLQFESVSTHDVKDSIVNGSNESCKSCLSYDHTNNCHIHNPDFASIVIRRRAPDLCRNGCTQRIHTFERSLFGRNISLSGNADDVQNETLIRRGEDSQEVKGTKKTDTKNDVISQAEKLGELKVASADADLVKLPFCKKKRTSFGIQNGTSKEEVLAKLPICRKKRRIKRRKQLESRFSESDQVEETKASCFSCTNSSLYASDTNDPSKENSSKVCENEAQKDMMSPSAKVPTETTVMNKLSGSQNDAKKEKGLLKSGCSWDEMSDNKERFHKSYLTGQESLSMERLEVPAFRANFEAANQLSDKQDLKASDRDEKVSCQPANNRLLKYTFQRKRKDTQSSPDVDCSLEESSLKKKCEVKQNEHVKPQKSCSITESSRDSRQLAQVARQLISLSEKKWWQ
ncbi:uncharacterized protein LOC129308157 [Prosopis cineraria]|uniref:uncharacterized protein LOC129308157 n=1 Tax=Prosopis cineraria TaxID=364024 RepID=UPI00240F3D18|nr:uncharacterized protein LOC129308157 [Prosopis cineraria]